MFRSPVAPASQENIVEESVNDTPEGQLATELGSATGAADFLGDMDGPSLADDYDEPDLPPTPTQLGLDRPPERPRGLSSSPSSKWGKRRAKGDLEQSPSKLRAVDYNIEPEGLTEQAATVDDTVLPTPILEKQKLKGDLSAELDALKRDIAQLEGLCERFEKDMEDIEPYISKMR